MPKFTSSRWFIIGIQVLIWIAFLLLPISMERPQNFPIPNFMESNQYLGLLFCVNALLIVYFYFNFSVLVPRILIEKGFWQYCLFILGCAILWLFVVTPFLQWLFDTHTLLPFFNKFKLMPFIFITAISLAARLTVDRIQDEKRIKESENETLKSELSFLRSQISPHFLLNVINAVVSFSRRRPELVEPTLIKLGQIIRYMLYEKDGAKVDIQKEIDYLESYIELQKMRFGDSIEINFDKNVQYTEGVQIESMLLIPFVENAFKHGVGLIQKPLIDIDLKIDHNQLIFNVLNRFNPAQNETKDNASGIGLKNVSRRLDLLYAQAHSLDIKTNDDVFEINLKLNLN